ncbi:MAG: exonuclease domain-containing protein [Candidatus Vidania fulgoroideorum]
MKHIVFIDLETTGLDYIKDRIIEIACIKLNLKNNTTKTFHSFLNTDRKISKSAFKIHKIKKSYLLNKPKFIDISKKLLLFIDNYLLVAHNAIFDISFLKNEYKRIGLKINFKYFDTLKFIKRNFSFKKNSLSDLVKRYNLNYSNFHSALNDVQALLDIYFIIKKKQKKFPISF